MKSLIHRSCPKKEELPLLGSGKHSYNNNTVPHSSIVMRNYNNDPYMPHVQRSFLPQSLSSPKRPMRHVSSSSIPPTRSMSNASCYNHYSPTNLSRRETTRRSPVYQSASSISSTDDDDDDDDNAPLGLMLLSHPMNCRKPFSLLSDLDEDGDDDLMPIAKLSISRENNIYPMSAAEKYKQKVRAKLHMDDPLVS